MRPLRPFAALLLVALAAIPARAGLHYSAEPLADLPSQWRGFLGDLRMLRGAAVKPANPAQASPLRKQYLDEIQRFRTVSGARALTADELADLGALLIRVGDLEGALEVLRPAQREHPRHFALAANLGTAWQLVGDLASAADALRLAVELAPGKVQRGEQLHLRLVQARLREPRNAMTLDDLFGVRYVGEDGKYAAGRLAVAERKKLPADAVSQTQLLLLWLPGDTRLLWQLGELANAYGDVTAAAELLELCVAQFGLTADDLRDHRRILRAAADAPPPSTDAAKAAHTVHGGLAFRSRRPLAGKRFDVGTLAPIQKDGTNPIPWGLLQETAMDGRQFRPQFPKYLKELDGYRVSLLGYLQPVSEEADAAAFMLVEYPVGCWYCEMPEVTGIILVELAEGKTFRHTREQVTVVGKLHLNATDPENFLFTLQDARIGVSD